MVVFDSKITPKEKTLYVGFFSPNKLVTTKKLKELEKQGFSLKKYMVSHNSLKKVWNHYSEVSLSKPSIAGVLNVDDAKLDTQFGEIKTIQKVKEAVEKTLLEKTQHKISKILKIFYAGALNSRASDL